MATALALALLLQDTAADLLRKVEEKYAAAKTLSVTGEIRFSGKRDGKDVEGTISESFRSRGAGEVRVELSGAMSGRPIPKAAYISDGKALGVLVEPAKPERKEHGLALGTWARRFLVRAGLMGTSGSLYGSVYQAEAFKLEALYKVGDVADGGKEKIKEIECRIISCTVASPDPAAAPLKCRLWIDPQKLVVHKRETVQEGKSESVTIAETYSDTTFDAEIADDVFKIPP